MSQRARPDRLSTTCVSTSNSKWLSSASVCAGAVSLHDNRPIEECSLWNGALRARRAKLQAIEEKSRPLETRLKAGKHRNGALMRSVRTKTTACEQDGWPGEYIETESSMAGCCKASAYGLPRRAQRLHPKEQVDTSELAG